MIGEAIRNLVAGQSLSSETMREVFSLVMDHRDDKDHKDDKDDKNDKATDIQKSALLVALRMKGETAEEIAGAAMAMRDRVTPLGIDPAGLIDTCGTGGDGKGTFNVSTAAAIVAAGAGARVAKHGNRAVSSSCGSADVLMALGVNIDLDAPAMAAVLNEVGISFLFAPKLHPAMRSVAHIRRELGFRTIFNVLGPLTNPAFAHRQVIGVYSLHLVEIVAQVLRMLGSVHALVVHSEDGMDEISVSAPTAVCELRDGEIRKYSLSPEHIGLERHDINDLTGGSPAESASMIRDVLSGKKGAPRDVVLANAGAALYVAGKAGDIGDGVEMAARSIDRGDAFRKLEQLAAATGRFALAGGPG